MVNDYKYPFTGYVLQCTCTEWIHVPRAVFMLQCKHEHILFCTYQV